MRVQLDPTDRALLEAAAGGGGSASEPMNLQTSATGANFTPFASQACRRLTILNGRSGAVPLEVRKVGGSATFHVPVMGFVTVYGENANEWEVRRVDQSNTQVTLGALAVS